MEYPGIRPTWGIRDWETVADGLYDLLFWWTR